MDSEDVDVDVIVGIWGWVFSLIFLENEQFWIDDSLSC